MGDFVKVKMMLHVLMALFVSTCANMLTNADFEDGTSGWYCLGGCTVTPSTDAYQNSGSVMLSDRGAKWQGLAQRLPEVIPTNTRYELVGYIKLLTLAPGTLYDTVEMTMECLDSTNDDKPAYTKFGQVEQVRPNIWTKIGGYNLIPEGLYKCVAYIAVGEPEVNYVVDAVSLTETSEITDYWSLHKCVAYISVGDPEVNYVVDVMSLTEIPEMTDWRTEAEANIENLRKGKIIIRLKRAPPGNYTVEVKQTSHTFGFGSVVGADEMVDPAYQKYQDFFYEHFEWGVLGNALKWNAMERNRGIIDYERPGLALEALQNRGIKIRGHNVFWGVQKHVPTWVQGLSVSELRQEISDRIQRVVNFTKGIVEHWDVNNEVLHGEWFEQALGDPNITMCMFEETHEVDDTARLFLNDYGILESHHAMGIRSQAVLYQAAGVPVHAVGLQSHIKPSDVDITILKKRLDAVAESGLPIWITELSMDEPNATIKAQALTDVMTLYFGHPSIKGIVLWGFSDLRIWKPDSKLFEGPDITPNEAGTAFLDLMNKWRTEKTIVLAKGDTFSFRGFKGDYSVTVKSGDTVWKRLNVSLDGRKIIRLRLKKPFN